MSLLLAQAIDLTQHYFIHALPYRYLGSQCPLIDGHSMIDRIKVLRWLSPTICASSFPEKQPHLGKDYQNALFGVILGQGEIEGASVQDLGLTANFKGERGFPQGQVKEDILNVINSRTSSSDYNDLVVSNPQVAGVYFNADGGQNFQLPAAHHLLQLLGRLEALAPFTDEASKEMLLPMFIILNGQARPFLGVNLLFKSMVLSPKEQNSFDKRERLSKSVVNLDVLRQEAWERETKGASLTQLVEAFCELGPVVSPAQMTLLAEKYVFNYRQKSHYGLQQLKLFKDSYSSGVMSKLKGFESMANTLDQDPIPPEKQYGLNKKYNPITPFNISADFPSVDDLQMKRYSPHLPSSAIELAPQMLLVPPLAE